MNPIDNQTLLLIKQNYDQLNLIHSRAAFVAQTYHITCPKCGQDNVVNSRNPSDGTFRMDLFGLIVFRCKHCEDIGSIPVYLEGT
jgi:transposase-like protein